MNPNIDAFIKETRQFAEAHAKPKVRRVKIEKVNQAFQVRFLPVGLGENNLWFVQQGMHWHSRKFHIFCPRCVSVDFGGNPEAECPVCDLAEDLNNSSVEEISSFGFRLRANLQYLTYCLVYQYDPGRGDVEEYALDEVLKPWEFAHYKSSFDELVDYFRRGRSPKREFSVLDLEQGNDFWATKTTKGIRLQKVDERTPCLPQDENYENYLDQIFKAINQPKITIPTLKELETFSIKAEAAANGDDGGRPVGRRGVEEDVEQDQSGDDESVRPSRRLPRNPRRLASPTPPPEDDATEQDAAEQPEPSENGSVEEDQVPGAEVPARRVPARTAVAPTRTVARTATTPPARTTAAPRTAAPVRAATGAPARAVSRPAAAAPVRGAAPARAAAAPVRTAVTQARAATPPARPLTRTTAAAPAQSSVDEEEDPGVAEEQTDQAPPTDEALPGDDQQQEGAQEETAQEETAQDGGGQEETQAAEEEPPPQPAARPGRAVAPANSGLKNRLLNRARPPAA